MKLYCGKLYAPNMTDRDNFSDKKLALLPNSFWISPPFYYEMAFFPWCFMCKRTWTLVFGSGISSEFIMHNTRVIGLQIASKENVRRIASLVWSAMWNVHGRTLRKKCLQRQSLKISKQRWIFCLTAFDCSRLGYSDNDQVSGPVEFENFMNSIHVYFLVQSE